MIGTEQQAAEILKFEGVVALPSETVYGLAARIDSVSAIKKIFFTKQRPFFDPLIVHVDSVEMAKSCVLEWPDLAEALAKKFWPGPLTIVLPKNESVSEIITSGLESVALRIPDHSIFLNAIRNQASPLAAPSANRFGRVSPTLAAHVESEFESKVAVVDGGSARIGIESTVLLIRAQDKTVSVLRSGSILPEQILEIAVKFGYFITEAQSKHESPGQLKHHYMPDIPLVLVSRNQTESEVIGLTLEKIKDLPDQVEGVTMKKPLHIRKAVELTLSDDPEIAARELYSSLRISAESEADIIYFRLKEHHKEKSFAAIMERMTKASSFVL